MTRASLCLVLLIGCGNPPPPATAPTPPTPAVAEPVARELPPAHPPTQPTNNAGAAYSGTAGEVLMGGGYSYVRIDSGGESVWVAGPQAKIQVGQAVQAGSGSPMHNFTSKTLGRTFATIQFVPWVRVAEALPARTAAPVQAAEAGKSADAVEALAEGQTVAQLFADKAKFANKPVAVRGLVTKVNAGVMGTTFIHLQDGTGSAADKNNDLTVTTDDPVAVGQVVVVRGTLITNKDFGAGYRYDVLVEKAKVSK